MSAETKFRLGPDESRIQKLIELGDSSIEVAKAPSSLKERKVGSSVIIDQTTKAHRANLKFDPAKDIEHVTVNLTVNEIEGQDRIFRIVYVGNADMIIYQDAISVSAVNTENTGNLKFAVVSRRIGNKEKNWAFLLP